MVLPIFFILSGGRIIQIVVRVGSALSRFIAKNPRIIGGTISIQAISDAIRSHESSEKEKIEIANEIAKENPEIRYDLYKNIFHPDTNIISNIVPYLVVLLIIYIILKR